MRGVLLVLCFLVICGNGVSGQKQSLCAKGILRCGSAPAHGVLVRLVDKTIEHSPNGLLEQDYTNVDGEFHICSVFSARTNMAPELRVYHKCLDGKKKGQRKVILKIPDHYISDGETASQVFYAGDVNLEMKTYNEKRTEPGKPLRIRRQGLVNGWHYADVDELIPAAEVAKSTRARAKPRQPNSDESPDSRLEPW